MARLHWGQRPEAADGLEPVSWFPQKNRREHSTAREGAQKESGVWTSGKSGVGGLSGDLMPGSSRLSGLIVVRRGVVKGRPCCPLVFVGASRYPTRWGLAPGDLSGDVALHHLFAYLFSGLALFSLVLATKLRTPS